MGGALWSPPLGAEVRWRKRTTCGPTRGSWGGGTSHYRSAHSQEHRGRGGGPLLDCPSLDTGSLSFLAPLAPRSALEGLSPPWVFVAHVLLAVHSCDLAQLFPLSGPQFPFPPNTVKAFPAPTCCDWVWKPAPPEGWAPPPVPSPCPALGWHDVRAHSTLIDSERSSRQRP